MDDDAVAGVAAVPPVDGVAAPLLAVHQQRIVAWATRRVPELIVNLAVEYKRGDRFAVLDDPGFRPIEVRQLLAFGINLPVVGVALEDSPLALADRRQYPRCELGPFDRVVEVGELQQELLDVRPRRVLGMELLHVVRRWRLNVGRQVAGGARQKLEEERVGRRELGLDRVVVDLLQFHKFAVRGVPGRGHGLHGLVEDHVLPPEDVVIEGVRLPVGPADALAHMHGHLGAVLVPLVRGQHVRAKALRVTRPLQEILASVQRGKVAKCLAGGRPHECVAVLADLVFRLEHQWVGRQPLLHSGQLAGLDQRREHGSFHELCRLSRGRRSRGGSRLRRGWRLLSRRRLGCGWRHWRWRGAGWLRRGRLRN